MKYQVLIYNKDNPNPIGEVEANSIVRLKHKARGYASKYNNNRGRVMIQDINTLREWNINY